MPESISAEDVEEWLDEEVLASIQRVPDEVPDEGVDFRFVVELGGYNLTIYKNDNGTPLRIWTSTQVDAGTLANILDRPADRRHLATLFSSVLANVSGTYYPLDENGNHCDIVDMEGIVLETLVYPDEAGQGIVMREIMNITSGLAFVTDMLKLFETNLQEQS